MIKKIKLMLASLGLLLTFSLPLATVGVAHAQTSQTDINNNLCTGSDLQFTSSGGSNTDCNSTNADSKVNSLIKTIVNILSVIVGIVAVIMIIIGGFRYVTSGGKQESVGTAKNTILYAVIGLVIVALAQIVVHFVLSKTATTS